MGPKTDAEHTRPDPNDLASRLGRRAGRMWRDGRPELARLIERARPLAATAGKDALRYAREHEDEIKRTALKGARAHVRGPFGYVVGMVADAAARGAAGQPAPNLCPSCGAENPHAARFCNQCGARLATTPSD